MYSFLITVALLQPAALISELEDQGYTALRAGNLDRVAQIADSIAQQYPDNFSSAMARGSLLLRAGLASESLKAFDEAARLQPRQIPFMWQRGIAQYYAGKFQAGRQQFEVHREVNANDVENAVWHFVCVARVDGFDAARKAYLPAPGDRRVPLQQVYDLFAGTATIQEVIDAMSKVPAGTAAADSANFYGELYLGMYEESRGNDQAAQAWLQKAADHEQTSYMADIARVHLQQVTARLTQSKTDTPKSK